MKPSAAASSRRSQRGRLPTAPLSPFSPPPPLLLPSPRLYSTFLARLPPFRLPLLPPRFSSNCTCFLAPPRSPASLPSLPPPTPTQSMSQQSLCRQTSSAQSAMFNPRHRWLMRHCGDVKQRPLYGEQQLTCGGAALLPRLQDTYWQSLYKIMNVMCQRDER